MNGRGCGSSQHRDSDLPELSAPPRFIKWLAMGAAGVISAMIIGFTVFADDPTEVPSLAPAATTVAAPTTTLGEAFPDLPTPPPSDPTPTPDPTGAGAATEALVLVEGGWAYTSADQVEVMALIRNTSESAFANVTLSLILSGDAGEELSRLSFSYSRVEPGQILPLTGFAEVDASDIADTRVDAVARGTLPPSGAEVELGDWEWSQQGSGPVTVSGQLSSSTQLDFVAVVGVLRDDDGVYIGNAFGFVETVGPEPVRFEAVGFPGERVATVDVYVTG